MSVITGDGSANFIYATSGNDTIWAQGGNDTVLGGDGNDRIGGEDGNDSLRGGNGADDVFGGGGSDTIYGDGGDDRVFGGNGNDSVYGSAGHDEVYGGSGDDTLGGGSGSDTMVGGSGTDILTGGSGADSFVFSGDWGTDGIYDFDASEGDKLVVDSLEGLYFQGSGQVYAGDDGQFGTYDDYYLQVDLTDGVNRAVIILNSPWYVGYQLNPADVDFIEVA